MGAHMMRIKTIIKTSNPKKKNARKYSQGRSKSRTRKPRSNLMNKSIPGLGWHDDPHFILHVVSGISCTVLITRSTLGVSPHKRKAEKGKRKTPVA